MVLQIVGGRNTSTIEGPHATDWLYALECVDSFNKVRCIPPLMQLPHLWFPLTEFLLKAVPNNRVPKKHGFPQNIIPLYTVVTYAVSDFRWLPQIKVWQTVR